MNFGSGAAVSHKSSHARDVSGSCIGPILNITWLYKDNNPLQKLDAWQMSLTEAGLIEVEESEDEIGDINIISCYGSVINSQTTDAGVIPIQLMGSGQCRWKWYIINRDNGSHAYK